MNGIPISEVVLRVQRLALRPTKDAPMQWYGDTVRFMLLDGPHWTTSMTAFERICERAVAEYGLDYCLHNATIVEAPSEEALALVDVTTVIPGNEVRRMKEPTMLTKETAIAEMQTAIEEAEYVHEGDAYRIILNTLEKSDSLEAAIATLYGIAGRYAMYAEFVPMPSMSFHGYEGTVKRCIHLGTAIRRIAFSFEYALTGKDIEDYSVEDRLEDCNAFDRACLKGK